MAWLIVLALLIVLAAALYVGLVTGAAPVDLGIGRRLRPLGPQVVTISAPREVVFDLIGAPYGARPAKAMAEKVRVLERGDDMVLAAHRTPVRGRLTATTVETVRFTPPIRVDFRLVRGPVPHVVEEFILSVTGGGNATRLEYNGELGTDLWALGAWWGRVVGRAWERTVASSLESVKAEAERRHRASQPGSS
jgi:hypothetical protein